MGTFPESYDETKKIKRNLADAGGGGGGDGGGLPCC